MNGLNNKMEKSKEIREFKNQRTIEITQSEQQKNGLKKLNRASEFRETIYLGTSWEDVISSWPVSRPKQSESPHPLPSP